MVLAIGIVVDDAIVVVENVERVMGEARSRDGAARGGSWLKRLPARHHRHQPGAVVGFPCPVALFPHLGPAVPPVRRHHQHRHADFRRSTP
jgi:hypothetical protein